MKSPRGVFWTDSRVRLVLVLVLFISVLPAADDLFIRCTSFKVNVLSFVSNDASNRVST